MNNVPEVALHESLAFMEQGESIQQILARYPELAEELRPFLETAAQLATLAPQPSLAAKQKSQKAFLDHAESLKVTPIRPSLGYRLRQALMPLISLAVVLILFAVTAVSVSSSAIPGDALYSVKRLVETVRLNQTNDPASAAALMEQYQQERIREVQTLMRTRRLAEVTFVGQVQAIQTEAWTVASINVTLNAETTIKGQPQVGEMALVNGRTAEGVLTATTIEILTNTSAPPEPTITPEPTLLPTVTATKPPTVEATSSPTETPTVTTSSTPTPTLRPTVASTPSPMPTETASPTPTNDNDNGDNDNDNDNNDNDDDDNDDDNDSNGNGNGNDNDSNDNDDDDDSHDNGNDNDSNDNDDDNDDNNNDDNDNDSNDNGDDDENSNDSGNSGKGNNDNGGD